MTVDDAITEVVEEAVDGQGGDGGGDTEVTVVVDEGDGSATGEVAESLELAEQVRDIAADEAADAAQAAVEVAAAISLTADEVRAIAAQEADAAVERFAASLAASAEDNGAPVIEEIVEDATGPENDEPPRTQSWWYRRFGG